MQTTVFKQNVGQLSHSARTWGVLNVLGICVQNAGEVRSRNTFDYFTYTETLWMSTVIRVRLWVVFTAWRSFRNHKSQLKKGNGLPACLLLIFIAVLLLFSLCSAHCLPPSLSILPPLSLSFSFFFFVFFFLFFFIVFGLFVTTTEDNSSYPLNSSRN